MNNIDHELDLIYDAVDVLFREDCFEFVDDLLFQKTRQAWRTDINILLAYATATFPGKSKLQNRAMFLEHCKRFYPNPTLWIGLD